MNPKAVVILSCLAFVSAGCSRSGADAVRIKELEERHGKLEKEHQGAATESRKLGSRLTQMEQELTEQLAESKKVAGEREEFHAAPRRRHAPCLATCRGRRCFRAR